MGFKVTTKQDGQSRFARTGKKHVMFYFILEVTGGDAEQAYNVEEWAYICNHGETFESENLIVESV